MPLRVLILAVLLALAGCDEASSPPMPQPDPPVEAPMEDEVEVPENPEVTEVPEVPDDRETTEEEVWPVVFAFSPDGSRLLLLARQLALLVLLPEGRAITLRTEGLAIAVDASRPYDFSRDGVAIGLRDGRVGLFGDDGQRRGPWRSPPQSGRQPSVVTVSKSGREVAAIYADDGPAKTGLRIWRGTGILDVALQTLGWARDFRFEAHGRRLLVALPTAVQTYRVSDGRLLGERRVDFDGVFGYASVSRDGRWVAEVKNGGHDLVAWPRRLSAGHQHVSAATGCPNHLGSARFSPDGQRLVAHHTDGSFVTYTVGSFRRWVGAAPAAGRSLEVAEDGRHYVDFPATGTGPAELRDALGREPPVGLAPPATVYRVSPHGRYVVGEHEGTVWLWSAPSGTAPIRLWP